MNKQTNWLPFETAPKIPGQRILAWCKPVESSEGIVEYEYREYYSQRERKNVFGWCQVIDHPWPNASMCPVYWTNTIEPPEASSV